MLTNYNIDTNSFTINVNKKLYLIGANFKNVMSYIVLGAGVVTGT